MFGGLHRWPLGEAVVPMRKAGRCPPIVRGETKIDMSECAADGHMADDGAALTAHFGLEPVERRGGLKAVGRQVLLALVCSGRACSTSRRIKPPGSHRQGPGAATGHRGRVRPEGALARRAGYRSIRRSRVNYRATLPSSSTSVGILLSGFTAMTSALGAGGHHHPLHHDAVGNPTSCAATITLRTTATVTTRTAS